MQMVLGLLHMHSRHVLHRDLKTLNVFLDAAGNAKLGDLGVSKVGGATAHAAGVTPWGDLPDPSRGGFLGLYPCVVTMLAANGAAAAA